MNPRLTLILAGLALCASPGIAQANAVGQVDLGATVIGACGMGNPAVTELNLFDLTGADGKLDSGKTGTAVLATTYIPDAWCNGPHTLSLQTQPMTLTRVISYAQPEYMARKLAYSATLVGWRDEYTNRPNGLGGAFDVIVASARAAPAPGLQLNISRLQTLAVAGTEQAGLMLEYGTYRGTVKITLAAN